MDQYFTYEARLASFQKSSKKRASTTGGRSKALNWPHKQIAPASLAKAGFYFEPYPENPDNVMCFLCGKGLDGWEAGDDPLLEHLTHAPNCGWAIVAAIEAEFDDYAKQDPSLPHMVEARKATFAGKWPHETRKGWKCKTKQLVEAGWKYTPTDESDDMATCAYCQLALDGWEPSDKPYDEHYNRSPNCAFFALLNEFGGPKKKTTRGKTARASKASRLSLQSVATTATDIGSVADITAEPEDSVLTTSSILIQGGKKAANKKTKSTTARSNKSKSKKVQDAEQVQNDKGDDTENDVEDEPAPPIKATKATRSKKRASDAMDDSVILMSEAPSSKRQARQTRQSNQADGSTITPDDVQLAEVVPAKAGGRARSSSIRSSRKPSVLGASMASLRGACEDFPDDDEIERQLEADLEREFTDDDDEMAYDSGLERTMAKANKPEAKAGTAKPNNYAMFDPAELEQNEHDLDEELQNLQAEMEVDNSKKEELDIPKKGRKAGTRKVSKQTKAKKAKAPSPSPSPSPEPESEMIGSPTREEERVVGSVDAGVNNGDEEEEIEFAPTKKARGKAAKSSMASNASSKSTKPSGKPARAKVQKKTVEIQEPLDSPLQSEAQFDAVAYEMESDVDEAASVVTPEPKGLAQPPAQEIDSPIVAKSLLHAEPPSTPAKVISPAPSARQAALSPSQSPQSSDAENQPPSSVPTASVKTKRVVLAPVASTSLRMSPSKRNMLAAGLQSQTPWTAVDLDAVFGTPKAGADKENTINQLLKQGKDLTSPEKRMTVEEWIYFNAGEAEKKLKHECETMVSEFEREGTRAMNVLEGLVAE